MKKLEDFSNELFSLSNKQLSSIKGSNTGMGINQQFLTDASDTSWKYFTTQRNGKEPTTDTEAWDVCWDV